MEHQVIFLLNNKFAQRDTDMQQFNDGIPIDGQDPQGPRESQNPQIPKEGKEPKSLVPLP